MRGYIVKCRTDGRSGHKHGTYVFSLAAPAAGGYPALGFRVAISYPTNPEVLEGSDLSRAPVPDWSASIFPTPRPTRARRRGTGGAPLHSDDAGQFHCRVWSDITRSRQTDRVYINQRQSCACPSILVQ